jgi:heme A synthase
VIGPNGEHKQAFIKAFLQALFDEGIDTSQMMVDDIVPGSILALFRTYDSGVVSSAGNAVSGGLMVEVNGVSLSASSFASLPGQNDSDSRVIVMAVSISGGCVLIIVLVAVFLIARNKQRRGAATIMPVSRATRPKQAW